MADSNNLKHKNKGTWEQISYGASSYRYRCSVCGYISYNGRRNFCADCGVPMSNASTKRS